MNKICCFTGHRYIEKAKLSEINNTLIEVLKDLILQGFTEFIAGGAIGFDTLAANTVLLLKKDNPDIRLHLILPCKNQSASWNIQAKEEYERIKSHADEVECLSPFYFNGCMQIRNKAMVDKSDMCVAYVNKKTGGSAYTVNYAEKQGKPVINITDKL